MMFTSTVFASFTALLCTSFGFVEARIVQRDVVSPPITYPTAGTVWNVNESHNVTWDTSVIPPGINNTGMIVLGFLDAADPNNEHLDLKNPLSQGFPITVGHAEITVPAVTTRDSYIIVLFGDSGNASPKFTINNISITAPSPTIVASSSFLSASASAASTSAASASTPDAKQGVSSSDGFSTSSTLQVTSSAVNQTVPGSITALSAQVTSASSFSTSSVPLPSSASTAPAAAQSSASANAGIRSVSYGGAVTCLSSICSLALVLGFGL